MRVVLVYNGGDSDQCAVLQSCRQGDFDYILNVLNGFLMRLGLSAVQLFPGVGCNFPNSVCT